MDPMIIEFLMGIFASTVSVLLIIQYTGEKPNRQTIARPRKLQVTKSGASRRQTKPRRAKPRRVRRLRMRTKPQPAQPSETAMVAPVQTLVSACPSCGLQAPETLMAEHFTQSPSHEYGPTEPVTNMVQAEVEEESFTDEDSKNSLRSLLQMLVPPRAFGRRHAHRTVSPLSSIVQVTGDSGHKNFRP